MALVRARHQKLKGKKGLLGEIHYPFHICMMNPSLNTRYSRRPSPPVKEKKLKVAVIIFLHKGVVSVS